MNRYICIHGHFYQPPRENPWLEEIELEDSAYPYHDWNRRITAECYAPNMASRILDTERRIIDIENNYAKISFDFGPTLLSWMEIYEPGVYQAIIQGDKLSRNRFSGHGSAMAQVYSHMIMPLGNSRDKRTQVIWGIRDFITRFGREPEGMWLAETAVDLETLDILAEHGIRFTILAPHQAKRVRAEGEIEWRDVNGGKVDPKIPYKCTLPSGRTIALFFYDGPVSRDVAFGGLLKSGDNFASRLAGLFSKREGPQIAHIATDGESYGHHHRFGDMALAYALHHIESNNLATITNYGEYLEKYPPTAEVEIDENTSWSCAHGVERWTADCGCNTGTHPGYSQAWRAPLREAMNWLRDNLERLYEEHMALYANDPWQARDDYIEVILNRSARNVDAFLSRHLTGKLSEDDRVRASKLLEMQRHAMLMFTSCGWFFDEISGVETLMVMKHASRAMQLAKDVCAEDLEPPYLQILEGAPSNVPYLENGARIWDILVRPAATDLLRVGAHYAVSSLFEEYSETVRIGCYTTTRELYEVAEAGTQRLAVGKAYVSSDITGENCTIEFAIIHLGDHNVIGGIREYEEHDSFALMRREVRDAFGKSDVAGVIRLMDKHFQTHNYSLWHLFRDERRKVLNKILESTLREIETSFRRIYERHYSSILVMGDMGIPLPKAFATATELIIGTKMRHELEKEVLDLEEIRKLVEESRRWSLEPDKKSLGFIASRKVTSLMQRFSGVPEDAALLETIVDVLRALSVIPLELDLWKSQNIYFSICTQQYDEMEKKSEQGDGIARQWLEHFGKLGAYLNVRCR